MTDQDARNALILSWPEPGAEVPLATVQMVQGLGSLISNYGDWSANTPGPTYNWMAVTCPAQPLAAQCAGCQKCPSGCFFVGTDCLQVFPDQRSGIMGSIVALRRSPAVWTAVQRGDIDGAILAMNSAPGFATTAPIADLQGQLDQHIARIASALGEPQAAVRGMSAATPPPPASSGSSSSSWVAPLLGLALLGAGAVAAVVVSSPSR